jgi:hypothetical protein
MDIGIIGAGHIGATLARLLIDAGHRVAIANSRGPDTLTDLVSDLGSHAHAATIEEAATFGRAVIVAIPFGRFPDLPAADIGDRVLVDAMNYYPDRDGHFDVLDRDKTTSSEMLATHTTDARVVKAFNTIYWEHLRDQAAPAGADRRAIPIAGDDDAAKKMVTELLDDIGFDAADAGALADGRALQPGAPVYGIRMSKPDADRLLGGSGSNQT